MLRPPYFNRAAFTLIELLTVIVVISILSVMAMGVMNNVRARAEKASCISNLKNLYVGVSVYVQQEGHWPQIDPQLITRDDNLFAKKWIEALSTKGLSQPNWICPTMQRGLNSPDLSKPENARIDYMGMQFDDNASTPYRWPKQPWFIEKGAVHEGGNLMIWTNGQIVTFTDAIRFQ
jgi:prepilin-type N-terminal cleavage/methylation domain-containing protein